MEEIFKKIARQSGLRVSQVTQVFEIFAELNNENFNEQGERNEQSPIMMLDVYCSDQESEK